MGDRFQVQARLMRRIDGVVVHDETRLVETPSVEKARELAHLWAAEGLTTWVYVLDRSGGRIVHRPVEGLV